MPHSKESWNWSVRSSKFSFIESGLPVVEFHCKFANSGYHYNHHDLCRYPWVLREEIFQLAAPDQLDHWIRRGEAGKAMRSTWLVNS